MSGNGKITPKGIVYNNDVKFRWNFSLSFKKKRLDKLTNNKNDRAIAADFLAHHVIHSLDPKDDNVTLIGHSHGGNVSIQAARIIYAKTGKRVKIITIATPAFSGSSDEENPTNVSGIISHFHIGVRQDKVSGVGSPLLEHMRARSKPDRLYKNIARVRQFLINRFK